MNLLKFNKKGRKPLHIPIAKIEVTINGMLHVFKIGDNGELPGAKNKRNPLNQSSDFGNNLLIPNDQAPSLSNSILPSNGGFINVSIDQDISDEQQLYPPSNDNAHNQFNVAQSPNDSTSAMNTGNQQSIFGLFGDDSMSMDTQQKPCDEQKNKDLYDDNEFDFFSEQIYGFSDYNVFTSSCSCTRNTVHQETNPLLPSNGGFINVSIDQDTFDEPQLCPSLNDNALNQFNIAQPPNDTTSARNTGYQPTISGLFGDDSMSMDTQQNPSNGQQENEQILNLNGDLSMDYDLFNHSNNLFDDEQFLF